MEFKNLDSLLKHIEETIIPLNLEQIGEEIKGYLRRTLLTKWYESHMPNQYQRTDMLINSITVSKAEKVGGYYQVKIYFDENKIIPVPTEDKEMFPAHMNVTDGNSEYDGMTYGELLPLWIEEGQSSRINPYKGVHMVQDTIDWIKEDNYIKTRMMELLENKGYKVMM